MIVLYFIVIFIFGFFNNATNNKNEYFYLSRKLTLPSFIATIVTTWYGGILEIGRFSYYNGLVTWFIFGLFYYISAIIFAFYIGPKVHKNNLTSISQNFKNHYGSVTGKITSIILLFIASPAPYLMILATLLAHMFDINFNYALIFGIIFSIFYIYTSGLKAIIRTDKIQLFIMYLGFSLIFIYLILNFGGIDFLIKNSPKKNLTFTGNLPIGYILSWIVVSMVTFVDPSIYQRSYSSKNKTIIKKGMLISIILWFIFDFLSISIGIYASALIDSNTLNNINPYLYLADNFLPNIMRDLFFIALLSIVMSTIDSFFLVSSMLISDDLLDNNNLKNTKISLIIIGILSYLISINFNYVIDIWYIFGSIAGSSILLPFLLLLFKPNIKIKFPILTLILPIIVCLTWFYYEYPLGLDIMYPGILVSFTMCLINKENK